jgi:hypothetical protein
VAARENAESRRAGSLSKIFLISLISAVDGRRIPLTVIGAKDQPWRHRHESAEDADASVKAEQSDQHAAEAGARAPRASWRKLRVAFEGDRSGGGAAQ